MSQLEEKFEFTDENRNEADSCIAKYPEGREQSAVMPILYIAQRQNGGWLSQSAMQYVADYLSMPPIKVYEVATFYTMYNLDSVGEYHIQLCRTTPCWLRGANSISSAIKEHLGIENGETTDDGKFTLSEVECLGACVNAPMVQINDDFYEDLNADRVRSILDMLISGDQPKSGSQSERFTSAPESGPTTLIDEGKSKC